MPRSYDYEEAGGEHAAHNSSQILKNFTAKDKPVLDKDGKPCRTCHDFKTWMKLMGKEEGPKIDPKDLGTTLSEDDLLDLMRSKKKCPVDKDELGQATWKFLHTLAVEYPETPSVSQRSDLKNFMTLFSRLYPCEPCAKDLREDMLKHPVQVESGPAFAKWLCGAHNRVNIKLGKPEFDCDRVYERWRDGWKDGSCDY